MDLSKYSEYVNKVKDIDNQSNNIFKILKQENYETKHSTFLSWLFDVNASHGFGKEFAELFFKKCLGDSCDIDCNSINYVKTEVMIAGEKQKLEKKDKRRIDILIVGDRFTCTIENKYGSTIHGGQCPDYREYIEGRRNGRDTPNGGEYPIDEGWHNYFIFLDVKKPSDYDEELSGEYADYSFISYKDVKEILETIVKGKEKTLTLNYVLQYIEVLKDKYNPITDEYLSVCNGLNPQDVQSINEISDYSIYNSEELRFIEIVKQYYSLIKRAYDKEILDSIKAISQDEYFIKSDYGHGKGEASYAHAIPLSTNYLNISDYLFKRGVITKDQKDRYSEIMKRDSKEKELKKIINGKIKAIQDEREEKGDSPFHSVDYRALMDENEGINIAITCGFTTNDSKIMTERIDGDTLKSLKQLKDNGWTVIPKFYFQTGAGAHVYESEVEFDESKLFQLSDGDIERIFNQNYIGKTLDLLGVFNDDFFSYLDCLAPCLKNKHSLEKYLIKKMILSNEKKISSGIGVINEILKDTKCKDKYQKWLETNKKPECVFDASRVDRIIGEDPNGEIIRIKKCITDGYDICYFTRWMTSVFKINYQTYRNWEDVDLEVLDALLRAIDPLSSIIDEYDNKRKKDKEFNVAKSITKYVLDYIDKRTNKEFVPGILITMKVAINCADDSQRDVELKKQFYRKTIEGTAVFGYDKWFEQKVFKSKTDLMALGVIV